METIYLGAGCFWCVEAVYNSLKGVVNVTSGYMGGQTDQPTYEQVCSGTTGHAEVIKIDYDPEQISLQELLQVFWATHDPTTLNRQGADRGTQYRSAIFCNNPEQVYIAKQSLAEDGQPLWNDPIVTEISMAGTFFTAEAYHQSFYERNPAQAYCAFVIPPKLQKLHKSFNHLLKK
jgi:peptide-methionine (S)-S-oxide reductase